MPQRVLVISPTYDERDNLPRFVAAVCAALPQADVLIVDDASPDGTGELAEDLIRGNPRLHLLHRPAKTGLGHAYCAAFRWALAQKYDRIIQMDADFSHAPADLPPSARDGSHGGLQMLPSRGSGDLAPGPHRRPRLRLPNRDHLSRLARRLPSCRTPHRLCRSHRRHLQDVPCHCLGGRLPRPSPCPSPPLIGFAQSRAS